MVFNHYTICRIHQYSYLIISVLLSSFLSAYSSMNGTRDIDKTIPPVCLSRCIVQNG